MLVLSRRVGERIKIGESVYITIMDVDRGKVRLGIEAPASVPVFRTELLGENRRLGGVGGNHAKGHTSTCDEGDAGRQFKSEDFAAGIEEAD